VSRELSITIINLINTKHIDIQKLQAVTFNGIPDEIKGLRPLVWRILLNHFPLDTSQWEEHMLQSKKTYDSWKDELIMKPSVE
jgi:hypothetical protein